ncbi:BofC C-terminal domain-containing protein [Paenibacillus sp. SYP-B3998]|uniref:BofC C-terminal domain-containing protein n=1 Tax=Paenibacillus sp. SYP-B3998 TaxID=2678564 RepID=UPI0013D5C9D4|nr:BofC C-terminal domain-containing protein [Paenibacillus sp. SYP-B3998]
MKRRLRWKRGWIVLGTVIVICTLGWIAHTSDLLPSNKEALSQTTFAKLTPGVDQRLKEAITTLKGITDSRTTYLLKSYICGEERQQLGMQSPDQMIEAQMKHPNWFLSVSANGEVSFTEHINDLSPECKLKAVFGLDESGNLSLFKGTPSKENIIRTFFQLNIKHLESSLPSETVKQLHDGIRVSDLEEYNSVLSTFSDYAVEETERAMMSP